MDSSELETSPSSVAVNAVERAEPWLAPTDEMLNGDPLFEAIWQCIKAWDINVPTVYGGYMGATGNHVRAIYDVVKGVIYGA